VWRLTCLQVHIMSFGCWFAGGIRGSFSVLKKLLQEQYGLSDLPDTAPAPAIGAAPAVAAAEAAPAAAAAAAPGPLPAAAVAAAATGPAAAPGLFALADYVVYQELVASIVQVSDPQLVAKALAVCLAMVLINGLILLLRPVNQACKAAGSVGPAGLLSWLCWPLRLGLELPDSLGAVLGALLLVAVANKLLLVGVEVVAAALNGCVGACEGRLGMVPMQAVLFTTHASSFWNLAVLVHSHAVVVQGLVLGSVWRSSEFAFVCVVSVGVPAQVLLHLGLPHCWVQRCPHSQQQPAWQHLPQLPAPSCRQSSLPQQQQPQGQTAAASSPLSSRIQGSKCSSVCRHSSRRAPQ
jgi:hypothetical protein